MIFNCETPMLNQQIIKQSLTDILTGDIANIEDKIQKYFSHEYIQIVNGKELNFRQFVEHAKVLKKVHKRFHLK